MLLSFRFANHRSFAGEQQLNLTPAYPSRPTDAVRVAGIFGANASGKSNALQAFSFMRDAALFSDRAVEPGVPGSLRREPFALDEEAAKAPSRFVVDLLLQETRYTYGFSLDDARVVEEWLYHYPLKKKRRVFEREGDSFAWGESTRRDTDLERISKITAPTALYLSTIARFGRPSVTGEPQPLHDVYSWFRQTRTRARPGLRHADIERAWSQFGAEFQASVVNLLRAADFGIVDVFVGVRPAPEELPRTTSVDARVSFNRRPQLLFAHRGPGEDRLLGLQDESTGTQQLLDLAIDASAVLQDGGLMTVDEIDASLHPMLTAKLIALFHQDATNPLRSQLVFTSHDAALLGAFDTDDVLGRDEIWFTEKARDGTSTLYPLTDFKPRRDGENRQRRYLNGSYGGIPDLSMALFERAVATRPDSGADE